MFDPEGSDLVKTYDSQGVKKPNHDLSIKPASNSVFNCESQPMLCAHLFRVDEISKAYACYPRTQSSGLGRIGTS